MRKMNDAEIRKLMEDMGWATLCLVSPESRPYAIEFSYFLDEEDIFGLVHPFGTAAKCLAKNPHVCIKICDSDPFCSSYRAASLRGPGSFEILSEPEEIIRAWTSLERQLRYPGKYERIMNRYLEKRRSLHLLHVTVLERTGIISSGASVTNAIPDLAVVPETGSYLNMHMTGIKEKGRREGR